MIPPPGRCLAMAASAFILASALLLAGMPGAVLLALTPGLLCLAMASATGHGDSQGEGMPRTARTATARQAELIEAIPRTPLGKAPLTRRAPAPDVVRAH